MTPTATKCPFLFMRGGSTSFACGGGDASPAIALASTRCNGCTMIDLHTHSILSDGELVPSELARRAQVKGYRMIGICDHADSSNLATIIASLLRIRDKMEYYRNITIVPGIEITHAPKNLIGDLVAEARRLGAMYVVVHGETLAEPVEEGTNREAILAAPTSSPIRASLRRTTQGSRREGVLLEISARKGHCLANGHVAKMALKVGAAAHLQHRFPRPVRPDVRRGGEKDRSGRRALGGRFCPHAAARAGTRKEGRGGAGMKLSIDASIQRVPFYPKAALYGADGNWVRLSSNENPYPPSPRSSRPWPTRFST